MENKLSEELRHCLDGKSCFKCAYSDEKAIMSCRNLLQNAYEKIKYLEDLEKKGLLPKLPCPIGSDVYFIPSKVNFELNKINGHEESNRVYHQKVAKIVFTERGWYLECDKDLKYGTDHILVDKLYKETWFLTRPEAEETLKRMEREE